MEEVMTTIDSPQPRIAWKPNTLVNAHLLWLSVLDSTRKAGKKVVESEDSIAFWIRTTVVVSLFTSAMTGLGVWALMKLTGG
jgi:hypothetical protein